MVVLHPLRRLAVPPAATSGSNLLRRARVCVAQRSLIGSRQTAPPPLEQCGSPKGDTLSERERHGDLDEAVTFAAAVPDRRLACNSCLPPSTRLHLRVAREPCWESQLPAPLSHHRHEQLGRLVVVVAPWNQHRHAEGRLVVATPSQHHHFQAGHPVVGAALLVCRRREARRPVVAAMAVVPRLVVAVVLLRRHRCRKVGCLVVVVAGPQGRQKAVVM